MLRDTNKPSSATSSATIQGAQNDAPGHGVQGVVDLGERQRGADHRGHLVSAVEDRDGHVEHADLEGLAEPFRVAGGTVQGGLHLGTRRRVVVLHSRRVGFGIGQHVAFDADAAVRPRDHREPGVGGGPEGLDQRLELDGAVEQRRDLAADQLGARLQVVDGLLVVGQKRCRRPASRRPRAQHDGQQVGDESFQNRRVRCMTHSSLSR